MTTSAIVFSVLRQLASRVGYPPDDIGPDTSLTDEMGLDSLMFVELMLDLEDALGLAAFPMREWADRQRALGSTAFKVSSLVEACTGLQAQQNST
jgi:acyl carrier protein